MTKRWLIGAVLAASLALSASAALAQEQEANREHMQYQDGDRQAAHEWYNKHKDRPAVGFRDRDRLPPEVDSRVQPGARFDAELQRRSHPVPSELRRQLRPAPTGYRHVVVGGHIVLVDRHNQIHDVIHVREGQ